MWNKRLLRSIGTLTLACVATLAVGACGSALDNPPAAGDPTSAGPAPAPETGATQVSPGLAKLCDNRQFLQLVTQLVPGVDTSNCRLDSDAEDPAELTAVVVGDNPIGALSLAPAAEGVPKARREDPSTIAQLIPDDTDSPWQSCVFVHVANTGISILMVGTGGTDGYVAEFAILDGTENSETQNHLGCSASGLSPDAEELATFMRRFLDAVNRLS